jgi:asparagine synthase (glutamine-hydrolysing)
MCGILGSINLPFGDKILDLIKHRGPDDSGIEQFSVAGQTVHLGHRRLSIVDLSPAGHQPMHSACGNYIIIFNGEIYNHKDLRKKLPDIKFKGHSDTETIVNYIAEYGIDSIKDFNGIFAFAILNIRNHKIYLARDRYGVKPLYYIHSNNKFAFSSEIKPLKKLIETNFSVENLSTLLRLRYNPSPSTLFENVFKIRPGHVLEFDLENNKLSITSFQKPVNINHQINLNDALSQYEFHLENAVKRQLMSDVDLGVLLSGGIDSALILYYATKYYNKKIKTFTLGFYGNNEANEQLEARETAKLLQAEHYDVLINANQFDEVFKKTINIIEEPLGTTSIMPMYYLNQLASKYVKVVLTGQGADESLGGYNRYQGELYRRKIPSSLFKFLQNTMRNSKNEHISRGLYSLGEKDIVKRFDKIYSLFSEEEINNLIHHNSNKSIEYINYFYQLLEGSQKDPVEAMMSNDLRMNLSDDLLLYTDKISMNFSLEARVPMLDNDLVDFIESLPYSYRLKIGKGKIIHKLCAAKVLPKEIVHRKKKGFQSPTEQWFKKEIGKKYYDILMQKNTKFSEYFNEKYITKIFNQHTKQNINREKQIFTLISINYWMELFL